jgi:hypothetical protein
MEDERQPCRSEDWRYEDGPKEGRQECLPPNGEATAQLGAFGPGGQVVLLLGS